MNITKSSPLYILNIGMPPHITINIFEEKVVYLKNIGPQWGFGWRKK